jgi:hypothetical protein
VRCNGSSLLCSVVCTRQCSGLSLFCYVAACRFAALDMSSCEGELDNIIDVIGLV